MPRCQAPTCLSPWQTPDETLQTEFGANQVVLRRTLASPVPHFLSKIDTIIMCVQSHSFILSLFSRCPSVAFLTRPVDVQCLRGLPGPVEQHAGSAHSMHEGALPQGVACMAAAALLHRQALATPTLQDHPSGQGTGVQRR